MARRSIYVISQKKSKENPKRTSIGKSIRSRPKNKNMKKGWKKYSGQGKGRRKQCG